MHQLLRESLTEIRDRLDKAPMISLFLDFDGTLTPIVPTPEKARLNGQTKSALVDVMNSKRTVLHVISGRALEDVRARVGIDGVTYAGNHGLEIVDRTHRFVDPVALSTMEELRDLTDRLPAAFSSIPGVHIEFKKLTATIHYRNAARTDIQTIWDIAEALVSVYAPHLLLRSGAESINIMPSTNWNKGSAVRWINSRFGVSPQYSIYIGDDTTDEDAFLELFDGITIRVGDAPHSNAIFLLNDPAEVLVFLQWFAHTEFARRAIE